MKTRERKRLMAAKNKPTTMATMMQAVMGFLMPPPERQKWPEVSKHLAALPKGQGYNDLPLHLRPRAYKARYGWWPWVKGAMQREEAPPVIDTDRRECKRRQRQITKGMLKPSAPFIPRPSHA